MVETKPDSNSLYHHLRKSHTKNIVLCYAGIVAINVHNGKNEAKSVENLSSDPPFQSFKHFT